jgi:hypothetical protein
MAKVIDACNIDYYTVEQIGAIDPDLATDADVSNCIRELLGKKDMSRVVALLHNWPNYCLDRRLIAHYWAMAVGADDPNNRGIKSASDKRAASFARANIGLMLGALRPQDCHAVLVWPFEYAKKILSADATPDGDDNRTIAEALEACIPFIDSRHWTLLLLLRAIDFDLRVAAKIINHGAKFNDIIMTKLTDKVPAEDRGILYIIFKRNRKNYTGFKNLLLLGRDCI